MEDSVEATVVGVMSIMAMAVGMATAGLRLPCTLPTGRVETIIPPTGRAGTIIPPTGTAGTTLPTGTLETTTKAGAAGATRRLLMAVVGQGGSDRFRRIGCQKGATVEAAGRAAVAMTGKNRGFSLCRFVGDQRNGKMDVLTAAAMARDMVRLL